MATSPQFEAKGFFTGLFDFSFTTFITLKFLRVIYAILVVAIGLSALIFFLALATRGAGPAILGLILAPIIGLFYLVIARMYMEIIALFFRIAENTSLLVAALPGRPDGPASYGGGAPGGYGGGPGAGYGGGPGAGGQPGGPPAYGTGYGPPAAPPSDGREYGQPG